MHIAKISPPVFCLVWHFIINITTIIMAYNFFSVQNTILEKTFVGFSIVSVVMYGAIAAPLFVYSYKYGSSPEKRNGGLLTGISLMFLFSSVPMVVTMLIIILQMEYFRYYTIFIGLFALHSLAFTVGLFISWFAYMQFASTKYHRWRGPERQIPPERSGTLGVIPVTSRREHFPDVM